MSNVTIRHIAKAIGVSAATVSMVLNGKPGISEETRTRVLQEVKRSGYDIERLNTLQNKKMGTVDLIIFKKHGKVVGDTPFFSTLIESIQKEAALSGYNLGIRYNSPGSPAVSSADGVILLGTEMNEEDIAPYLQMSAPLVVLDNSFPGVSVNTTAIDNFGGGMMAAEHLVAAGHTAIGYLAGADGIRNFDERHEGFCAGLKKHGLTPAEVISLPANMDGARREMEKALDKGELKSTAFFADNDFIALGAMMAMRSRMTIGKDVSIIGFDDLPFSRVCEPQLTTLRVFNDVLGRTAVRRVIELSKPEEQSYTHTTVGVEMKIRGSVYKMN